MKKIMIPEGDKAREAIDALSGYLYQIYHSALALIELESEEILFLEVAEDYARVAANALKVVQVKKTQSSVTINSKEIVASIDSFVNLKQKNKNLKVRLHHLTTSTIGKERYKKYRIGNLPFLESWRNLSKTGDLKDFRKILETSKLKDETKKYIRNLNDTKFREEFLKKIHFDCGTSDPKYLERQLHSKLSRLVRERGGVYSQVDGCLNNILMTILQKATEKEDRFLDRNNLEEILDNATQISINRAQFDRQNQIINTLLSGAIPQSTSLVASRIAKPRPIDEVPLPEALASRDKQIKNIKYSLSKYGLCWIYGAAGVGKTTGAKIAAKKSKGNWVSTHLRNLNSDQVNRVLSDIADNLSGNEIDGLLIDDIECPLEAQIVDTLLYLQSVCKRGDILLVIISPKQPTSYFLFSTQFPASIAQKFENFSEYDLKEILSVFNVNNDVWVKYIYVLSGGGHPQLAIAAIQSMKKKGWDVKEFSTFSSLLQKDGELEEIRKRIRERLLNELSNGARRLLERLSLKVGFFKRSFVLDIAKIEPSIPDGGIIFDQLTGSWVDQLEQDKFVLSPLLSNFAYKTLSDDQKRLINFEIASSLVRGNLINPIDANSALIAALSGKNTQVINKLSITVLTTDNNNLELIMPHLFIFSHMRTDDFVYEENLAVNQIFRGAQLLLISQEETGKKKFVEALNRFRIESESIENTEVRLSMLLLVYSKLLLSNAKFGVIPNFWDLVHKLDLIISNKGEILPNELLKSYNEFEIDGVPILGFLFLNQAQQIKLINELPPMFEFLQSCEKELQQQLLKPFENPKFDIDLLVSAAWLSEHKANTIDPVVHSQIFSTLEELAKSIKHKELVVCCRKYRAMIIDEYGDDKDQALTVIDEGLQLYGMTNSELVRAKARILHRLKDHKGSLELSKTLIESDAPLNIIEKSYLGRDAAISAERQGDYEAARRYYLYGSNAAKNSEFPEMIPMKVGLLADAALASWHAGDRETCLSDFVKVLHELTDFKPSDSLRTAHCHASCRHVLLWLHQDATGEKQFATGGEEIIIYPGVVSNPEPHPEIINHNITPIEMAWYLLAVVENDSILDVNITKNLESHLPNGPVIEGQHLLNHAEMRKSIIKCDSFNFVNSLKQTVNEIAYVKQNGGYSKSFDMHNIKYGLIPKATLKQKSDHLQTIELFILCFASNCIFSQNLVELDQLVKSLYEDQDFRVRNDFLECFRGKNSNLDDFNINFTNLLTLHRNAIDNKEKLSPKHVFELAFKTVLIASQIKNLYFMAKPIYKWLSEKWALIIEDQRFLLYHLNIYEVSIAEVQTAEYNSWNKRIIDLLQAILPTMGFSNENELIQKLKSIY